MSETVRSVPPIAAGPDQPRARPARSAVVTELPSGARIANAGPARSRLWILSAASVTAVLVAWYLLTDVTGTVDKLYFPSVADARATVDQLGTGLLDAAWATTWRVLVSWAVGCTIGTAVGLLLGRSKIAYYLFNPLIEALRPVPPIALIPFVILWFGLGESGRLLLGGLSCFMIMVVQTTVATRNVDPVFLQAARTLGAGENRVYRTVVLRAIVPQLVAGLRIAAALAWAVIVAAEYLGAQNGVGYLILQASRTLNTSTVLVGTIVVGLLAFAFEQLIRIASDRATRWVQRG